jgi:hypothetical protein
VVVFVKGENMVKALFLGDPPYFSAAKSSKQVTRAFKSPELHSGGFMVLKCSHCLIVFMG